MYLQHTGSVHHPLPPVPLGICWEHFRNMAGSHFGCEQDVTNGHIWGTYPDYIPDVNRMFLLGKCWAKCLNACNVFSMFPLKSRYPHPQYLRNSDSVDCFRIC
jgi:hypothetical protein